jgi:hypothetical protein
MKIKNRKLFIKYCSLNLLIAVIAIGCTSFPGKELPTYTYEQIPAPEMKITVSFDTKAISSTGDTVVLPEFDNSVQKILTQSPVFAKTIAKRISNESGGEYNYTFYLRGDIDNERITRASSIFSGLTLGILPVYWRENISLAVVVKHGEKAIKTYIYRDHYTTWGEILLLPVMPLYLPRNTSELVIDNMLMNFVHDFSTDLKSGVLALEDNGSDLPATPDNNNALVYVVRPSGWHRKNESSVFLDSKEDSAEMGFNEGSQYIYFSVPSGEHQIFSYLGQQIFTYPKIWAKATIRAKSGEIYFMRQGLREGRINNQLTVVDAQEGLVLIKMSQPGTMLKIQQ